LEHQEGFHQLFESIQQPLQGGVRAALAAALYLTRQGDLPSRDWIAVQLVDDVPADAASLLAARPKIAGPDKGPTVCVCFNVGAKEITSAISRQCLTSLEGIGTALNAGTNCGSCRPALAKLLAETDKQITQICFESGYNNLANFNHYFKHIMGKTPSDYRKTFR